jgi:cell division protein FtsB
MDLRLGPQLRPRILQRPEDGLRAVMDHAPRAEAAAVRWIEKTRPAWSWVAREWRRLGTFAALLLIAGVLLHAMYGQNGVAQYQQKRNEMKTLQQEVDLLQKQNEQYAEQIRALKQDPAAIEKEAREGLHYARPGEIVLVAPDAPRKPATGRAQNQKQGQ